MPELPIGTALWVCAKCRDGFLLPSGTKPTHDTSLCSKCRIEWPSPRYELDAFCAMLDMPSNTLAQ